MSMLPAWLRAVVRHAPEQLKNVPLLPWLKKVLRSLHHIPNISPD